MAQLLQIMKKTLMKKLLILTVLFLVAASAYPQLRKIPHDVTNAFTAKYPDARNVTWKDNLTNFIAEFDLSGNHTETKFNKNGEWLETTVDVPYDKLRGSVKDGISKSKYADWTVREIKELQVRDKETTYRVFVVKSDLNRRYLTFNVQGQLIRDALTL